MECFHCFGSAGRQQTANTTRWMRVGNRTYCGIHCTQAYYVPVIQEMITILDNKEIIALIEHPAQVRMVKIEIILLKATLKHSKREQLLKLKEMLQDARVETLMAIQGDVQEGDYLKWCNGLKKKSEVNDLLIGVFAS